MPDLRVEQTLFGALLGARDKFGGKTLAIEDAERSPLSYDRLILGALVLGKAFARETERGETVGLLLPSVNAAAVSIFGLSAYGRVASPLNFTAGLKTCVLRSIRPKSPPSSPPINSSNSPSSTRL